MESAGVRIYARAVDVSEIERLSGANECDFSLSTYIQSTFNVVLFIII